jgi:hypothetical protein
MKSAAKTQSQPLMGSKVRSVGMMMERERKRERERERARERE